MLSRGDFGRDGEAWVAAELARNGWQILGRNWHCALGEIDLICRRGEHLVFVEVRSVRTPYLSTAAQSVSPSKQHKVARAAQVWLQRCDFWPQVVRFDVYAVSWTVDKGFEGEHIIDAFESPYAF